MFATPLRCYGHIKNINGVLAIGSSSLENLGRKVVFGIGRGRCASDKGKDKDCCKEDPQTAGRCVEPWPKTEPVTKTPWRTECSREPQPPNYDPYRIKVPEVVVPPLPPSNAKWRLLTSNEGRDLPQVPAQGPLSQGPYGSASVEQHSRQKQEAPVPQEEEQDESFAAKLKGFFDKVLGRGKSGDLMEASEGDMFYQQMHQPVAPQDFMYSSPVVHPDYWRGKTIKRVSNVEKEVLPKLGYHGIKRLKYAFHEPWRPLDRLALLQQAERDDGLGPDTQQEAEGTEEGEHAERAAGKER